jgi:hypothetical protein
MLIFTIKPPNEKVLSFCKGIWKAVVDAVMYVCVIEFIRMIFVPVVAPGKCKGPVFSGSFVIGCRSFSVSSKYILLEANFP